jgi:microcystin-dependent protein
MKKLITCFLMAGSLFVFGQNSGKGFGYQAVARSIDGQIKAGTAIEVQYGLYTDNLSSQPDWQETHSLVTDSFGVFNATIGKGVKNGGVYNAFNEIDFGKYAYWLQVDVKDNGSWQTISKTQLQSVPYAEYAGNTESTPVGSIMPFAGIKDKIPTGWLLCNGDTISKEKYKRLYDVIGSSWGNGDGSTTFHLPKLQGMFLRGVDEAGTVDTDASNRAESNPGGNKGATVGSIQGDELKSHKHIIPTGSVENGGARDHGGVPMIDWTALTSNVNPNSISYTGGSETRPKNAAVYYIIKY